MNMKLRLMALLTLCCLLLTCVVGCGGDKQEQEPQPEFVDYVDAVLYKNSILPEESRAAAAGYSWDAVAENHKKLFEQAQPVS